MSRLQTALLSFALVAALPLVAGATSYNPVSLFSFATNPGTNWSYGYGAVGTGAITLYGTPITESGTGYSYTGWSLNGGLPVVEVGSGLEPNTKNAPAGDLLMHPGDSDSQASILVFTAPTTGSYSLSGLFERDDVSSLGNGTHVYICENTTDCSLYSINLPASGGYLTQQTFSLTENLTAGQTLDFEVARVGSFVFDSTGLQLNITGPSLNVVPEPSSLVFLGTGIVGLAGVARRKLFRS
ncbi:MAG TPA: PEP-CTERM sorting domain-containing protein [Acidobacteriaceae bacterium]